MVKAKKETGPPVGAAIPEGYTYEELRPLIGTTLGAGISVLLRGHPGVGKSTLAKELSDSMSLEMIDIRLAQRDPADLCGVYFPDRDRKVLDLFPPEWVRRACERPCFVFLDEINAAVTKLHQAVAYQIVLEHRVGPFAFHEKTVVMAAGNLEEDNAIVTSLSSALCNRFAHYIHRVDAKSWLEWGAREGIAPAILAYVGRFGDEALYRNSGDLAFPTPRSWHMASRVLEKADPPDRKRVVAACVGIEAAEKFFDYLRIYHQVDAAAIVRRGEAVDFRKGDNADPSFIYAAIFAVAAYVTNEIEVEEAHLPNVVKFLRSAGLDPEFKFLFLRQVRRGKEELHRRLRRLATYRALAEELVDLRKELYL